MESIFSAFHKWELRRSPLAPSVPLEGTDTVEGLRSLEQHMHISRTLNFSSSSQIKHDFGENPRKGPGDDKLHGWKERRRRYRRYKGPFVEQLHLEDLKKEPQPWNNFFGRSSVENRRNGAEDRSAYSIPASLDLLSERIDENYVKYCSNYLRVTVAILITTLYLRPIAVLGAAALLTSGYFSVIAAVRNQNVLNRDSSGQQHSAKGSNQNPEFSSQSQMSAWMMIASWLIIVYTRCIPIIALGLLMSLLFILLHSSLREAPSESRYRGSAPISFSISQVIGLEERPENSDTKLMFKEIAKEFRVGLIYYIARSRLWLYFQLRSIKDLFRWRRSLLNPQPQMYGEWN